MLNKISNKKWDGIDVVELNLNNYKAIVIPELGGNIIKLSYYNEDILNTPKNLEAYKNAQNNYGIPHLFPPNRIKDGKFIFNGRDHQFPIKPSGNSLHGFLHFSGWKVLEKKIEDDYISLKLSYTSEKKADYYSYFPYEFKCTREYVLTSNGLTENYRVENLGNKLIPLSVGNHTAFPLGRNNNTKIRVDIEKLVILNDTKIPTGEIEVLSSEERKVAKEGVDPNFKNLDHLYMAKEVKDGECHKAIIINNHPMGDTIYEVDNKYRYWVLCNYESRGDIICIEPQTSSIDAHNREDGNLIKLEAKKTWNTTNKLYIKTKERCNDKKLFSK